MKTIATPEPNGIEMPEFVIPKNPLTEVLENGREVDSEIDINPDQVVTLETFFKNKNNGTPPTQNGPTLIALKGKSLSGSMSILPPFEFARSTSADVRDVGKKANVVSPRQGLFSQAVLAGESGPWSNPPTEPVWFNPNAKKISVEGTIEIPITIPYLLPYTTQVEITVHCYAPLQTRYSPQLITDSNYVGVKGQMAIRAKDTSTINNIKPEFKTYLNDYNVAGLSARSHFNSFSVTKTISLQKNENSFTLEITSFLSAVIENYHAGQLAAIEYTDFSIFLTSFMGFGNNLGSIKVESIELSFFSTRFFHV